MSNADSKRIIFFADTHLSPAQPDKSRFVIDFLHQQSRNTTFYILGDFFDIWIGPAHIKLPDYAEILKELKKLTASGVAINLIPGNRDYMVGPELTRAAGIKVLPPVFTLDTGHIRLILTHGDLLCTNDTPYQGYRRLLQSRIVKSVGKSLPGPVGRTLGKGLRRNFSTPKSEYKILPGKNIVRLPVKLQPTIPGSNSPCSNCRSIVIATAKRYLTGCDAIICGHIHRHSQTRFGDKQLFVVGDWDLSAARLRNGQVAQAGKKPSWVEYTPTDGLLLK
ncbi:MAG: UDP-2,3-diacylglucosamine diphosphatase [Planctomycetes bacterium]|nr:UDP-2,3-diacylglucosamine diphosphatase [Planctomycetota bacterium]